MKVNLLFLQGGGWQDTIAAVDDALAHFSTEIWDRGIAEQLLLIKAQCQKSLEIRKL